jgi:predicted aconitase
VCYANSVIGARTNREGGPSALASALTGLTPEYGLHLPEKRLPTLTVEVSERLAGTHDFGALGKAIGEHIQASKAVPYLLGVDKASLEELKSFCASLATYGGAALFHMAGITPEAANVTPPAVQICIKRADMDRAIQSLTDVTETDVDFVSLGCPHLSLDEIAQVARLLVGRKVKKEFWITTARVIQQEADRLGYAAIIEAAGAKFATDTCCVVSPIQGRFNAMATDSAKACFYAASKNRFKTRFLSFEDVVKLALQ